MKNTFVLLVVLVAFFNSHLAAADRLVLEPGLSRSVSPTTHLGLGVVSLGFVNSTCTASIVSKKGHVITAAHCVESAVLFANIKPNYKSKFLLEEQAGKSVKRYTYQDAVKTHLEIPFGLDDSVVYGSILSIGKGWLYPRFDIEVKNQEDKLL